MNSFQWAVIAFAIVFIYYLYLRFAAFGVAMRWLQASPVPKDPLWQEVERLLASHARKQRVAVPNLYVLPDFSPNALVLRGSGKEVVLVITEGLVRTLSNEELEGVLALGLSYAQVRGRRVQTLLALGLFPFARFLKQRSVAVQYAFAPIFTLAVRLCVHPKWTKKVDRRTLQYVDGHAVAAALQKMAVLGRKVPFQHWNLALDHLFLLSPMVLEGDPFWLFPSQPNVEQRRHQMLRSVACERSGSLS